MVPSSTVLVTISVSPWCRSACLIRSLIKSGMSIIRPCIAPPPSNSGTVHVFQIPRKRGLSPILLGHLDLAAAAGPDRRQAALGHDDGGRLLAAQLLQFAHGALDPRLGGGPEHLRRLVERFRLE